MNFLGSIVSLFIKRYAISFFTPNTDLYSSFILVFMFIKEFTDDNNLFSVFVYKSIRLQTSLSSEYHSIPLYPVSENAEKTKTAPKIKLIAQISTYF